MPSEVWKPVVGYEGFYQVSNLGRVRSLIQTLTPNYFAVRTLRKQSLKGDYLAVHLSKNAVGKKVHVHTLVCHAFLGPQPEGYQAHHKNGVKTDNRVQNLCYVTPSENTQHAHDTGLVKTARGERRGISKLTEAQVKKILCLKGELTQRQIAKRFGVSRSLISLIFNKKLWKHVQ